jgi:transcriptional regulator with XRE-family HTH domain
LSAASGLSRQTISALERNKGGSPTIETLERLLKECEVTLEEFFRGPENQCKPIEKCAFHKLDLMLQGQEEQFVSKLVDVVFKGLKNGSNEQQLKIDLSQEAKDSV